MFRHPNYYKELRKRNKSDQAISDSHVIKDSSDRLERAPGPGQSLTRDSNADGGEGSSSKHQASSDKLTKSQASSGKHQAPSTKAQA
jgi:hypothetical protein